MLLTRQSYAIYSHIRSISSAFWGGFNPPTLSDPAATRLTAWQGGAGIRLLKKHHCLNSPSSLWGNVWILHTQWTPADNEAQVQHVWQALMCCTCTSLSASPPAFCARPASPLHHFFLCKNHPTLFYYPVYRLPFGMIAWVSVCCWLNSWSCCSVWIHHLFEPEWICQRDCTYTQFVDIIVKFQSTKCLSILQ